MSIIDMDGNICDQVDSILIDLGYNSYANHDLIDKCCLNKEVHAESWLVQLATDTKKRVHHWVRACAFELDGMSTIVHLNILALGSYSMLLGMYWLYLDMNKMDCYDKSIELLDDNGEPRFLQGKKKSTSVRMVIAM